MEDGPRTHGRCWSKGEAAAMEASGRERVIVQTGNGRASHFEGKLISAGSFKMASDVLCTGGPRAPPDNSNPSYMNSSKISRTEWKLSEMLHRYFAG